MTKTIIPILILLSTFIYGQGEFREIKISLLISNGEIPSIQDCEYQNYAINGYRDNRQYKTPISQDSLKYGFGTSNNVYTLHSDNGFSIHDLSTGNIMNVSIPLNFGKTIVFPALEFKAGAFLLKNDSSNLLNYYTTDLKQIGSEVFIEFEKKFRYQIDIEMWTDSIGKQIVMDRFEVETGDSWRIIYNGNTFKYSLGSYESCLYCRTNNTLSVIFEDSIQCCDLPFFFRGLRLHRTLSNDHWNPRY
jgi:hypothetical protein